MRQIAIAGLCCLFVFTHSQAQGIFDRSRNSVLHIVVEAHYQDGRIEKLNEGTGFLITSDGHVLTANHVVDSDIKNATVVVRGSFLLRDETKHRLYVREKWKSRDVALLFMSLDVRELSQTEPLIMGDSSSLKVQDRVVSMGFPIGAELQRVSGDLTGKVAEGGLWVTGLLVAKGSSGGPVFSDVSSAVGIMTSGTGAAGINLFRPIDDVKGSLREVGIRFPEAVGISSDEACNPVVSKILGAISDRAQLGAIAYATQLKVDGEYRLLQSMLYAEAVQISSGALIKISEVAAADEEVILRLGAIEVIGGEDPAYIVWDRVGRAAGGASYSGAAAGGQNGAGDGESGRPGASGAAGGLGEDGVGAPDVILIIGEITGPGLVVDLSGQAGGNGGRGQDGGPGGHGARGRPASQSAFDCKRGPGHGGKGGSGGDGGNGGLGGGGGDGGNLTIITLEDSDPAVFKVVNGLVAGGAEGQGGAPGLGGPGGRGGPEGALALPYCRSAGRDGSPGDPGRGGGWATMGNAVPLVRYGRSPWKLERLGGWPRSNSPYNDARSPPATAD